MAETISVPVGNLFGPARVENSALRGFLCRVARCFGGQAMMHIVEVLAD
jgi:hypothetical protein